MGRINAELIRAALPRASQAFLRLNGISNEPSRTAPDSRAPSSAQPEQAVRNGPFQPPQREAAYPGRVSIRVTSYRRRLIDPDNLCPKYFLDSCRYAGLIRDDTPDAIHLQIEQARVSAKEEERTEILITPL